MFMFSFFLSFLCQATVALLEDALRVKLVCELDDDPGIGK